MLFSDDKNPNWQVVCRVDVCSRRSPLQVVVDDSEVLNIVHDSEFLGLHREFNNNNVLLANAPQLEIVYIPEMAKYRSGLERPENAFGSDSEETRLGDSLDDDARYTIQT